MHIAGCAVRIAKFELRHAVRGLLIAAKSDRRQQIAPDSGVRRAGCGGMWMKERGLWKAVCG
eukprot:6364422-Alexandrium_andersonii.AAC.1